MFTIQIKLPWERYHAHPWGQNPGRVAEAEWPPSPWRLLRSLAAAYFRTNAGQPASAELRTLLETLAKKPPQIGIGKVAFAKTVHYQPNYKHSSSDANLATYGKTRHENLFAATAEPFYFRWQNITLNDTQVALLKSLLESVTYFGRADSICEATLLGENEIPASGTGWCEPCLAAGGTPQKRIAQNCRAVFCPNPADFHAADLWQLRKNASATAAANVPEHLVNQLLADDMRVDGGLLVSYQMPDDWPRKWEVRTATSVREKPKEDISIGVKVAHYLRFSLQCRVPVAVRFAVDVANLFHKTVCKILDGRTSPALTGKDTSGHQHAFYLPAGDGTSLTDLHIWCKMGFTRQEMDVLGNVRHLHWGKSRFEINPVLVAAANEPPGDSGIAFGTTSKVWNSVTPFVPPLHFYRGSTQKPKFNANALPEKQLFECLKNAGLQKPVLIERIPLGEGSRQCAWDIVRTPQNDAMENALVAEVHKNGSCNSSGKKERRIGFFMRLIFEEPVSLPLPAFGHSSHFGLGLFAPMSEDAYKNSATGTELRA
jgi:CRISPR-associated protein Csb2